jgi:hypothetical protein
MTAINFPDDPEIGDAFSVGIITWEWTGAVWKASTTPPGQPAFDSFLLMGA